jgi:NAD(P) transhydrogenase subunit alpha
MQAGALLVGMFNPFSNETIARINARGVTALP